MEEGAVAECRSRHRAMPMIEDRELPRERREHGQHVGGERAQRDIRFLMGRRTASLRMEGVDVVVHESGHRRRRRCLGRVERRPHLRHLRVGIACRIDGAEQLRVHVGVVLARVGPRAAHHLVGGPVVRVGFDAPAFEVGVGERPFIEPGERLPRRNPRFRVQIAEQVVERPILEHHHDQVIESRPSRTRRDRPLRQERRRRLRWRARSFGRCSNGVARDTTDRRSGRRRAARAEEFPPSRLAVISR